MFRLDRDGRLQAQKGNYTHQFSLPVTGLSFEVVLGQVDGEWYVELTPSKQNRFNSKFVSLTSDRRTTAFRERYCGTPIAQSVDSIAATLAMPKPELQIVIALSNWSRRARHHQKVAIRAIFQRSRRQIYFK